jgi:predicted glycosyltransferase
MGQKKVLFDIGHPAHVHLFKNVIDGLRRNGHEVKITARKKEMTFKLLESYGLDYESRGLMYTGLFGKAVGMIKIDLKLLSIARSFQPDILIGVHNPYITHVGRLLGKPSIIFNDTENVKIASLLTYPFANAILTPSCFREHIESKKHIKINGYKELAYLHPNNFYPDADVLKDINLDPDDKFTIVRFISWGASHDIGLQGMKKGTEVDFINELKNYGEVYISSEKELDKKLERYRLKINPAKMHSLLHYAQMYIGEGGTMTTEAAVLGTPAIHIESTPEGVPTGNFCGNFLELRDKYNLLYFFANQEDALKKAVQILKIPDSKRIWTEKRNKLIEDKIDVAKWMIDFVEKYPQSFFEFQNKSR